MQKCEGPRTGAAGHYAHKIRTGRKERAASKQHTSTHSESTQKAPDVEYMLGGEARNTEGLGFLLRKTLVGRREQLGNLPGGWAQGKHGGRRDHVHLHGCLKRLPSQNAQNQQHRFFGSCRWGKSILRVMSFCEILEEILSPASVSPELLVSPLGPLTQCLPCLAHSPNS